MKDINIETVLKNNAENEIYKYNIKGTLENSKIQFIEEGKTNVEILIKNEEILFLRINSELEMQMTFKTNEKKYGYILAKEFNNKIDILSFTNKLIIEDNKIIINYDLQFEDDICTNFEYEIDWEVK